MTKPTLFRTLGRVERVMGDFRALMAERFGWPKVRSATQVWTSPEADIDQSQFSVHIEATNDVGYELCWMFEIEETGGRYTCARTLYGLGKADIYRFGQQVLFQLPDVTFDSVDDLCNNAVRLAEEFSASFLESLTHVPND